MDEPPTYREIADDIRRRIEIAEYPPGSAIPSYSTLSRLHGVSVSTAQKAVRLLEALGVVVGRQGRGVFVRRVEAPATDD